MASRTNTDVVKLFPRKVITPVVGALALVIGLSRGLLLFHMGEGVVKGAHEWLGMLFVIVMLIHMLSNWSALKKHLNQGAARLGILSIILIAGIFLGSSALSQQASPNPVYTALEAAPVTTLALLFQVDEKELLQELQNRGVALTDNNQNLAEGAKLSGLDGRETIKKLMASVGVMRRLESR